MPLRNIPRTWPRHARLTRFQCQAVLRRVSRAAPLRLVGVTLDSTFYPLSVADATGSLILTKGLVALAPLTAVDAVDALHAATAARLDASDAWSGLGPPDDA